ncbi:helix-hairpin-helix domain-containing protein [candidate division WOR-3 bacterium]|nr:helix-hairpin-helix domain-containing protein [candidate division WOR-3 bacterium]
MSYNEESIDSLIRLSTSSSKTATNITSKKGNNRTELIINLNTASKEELTLLPGIGPVYAERIIEYRKENGGFKNIDEITNVKGIGEKRFENLRDKIKIE